MSTLLDCCICCVRALPVVQNVDKLTGPFTEAMVPLVDAMKEYTDAERNVIKARVLPLIDSTEREAKRAEWWDTRMFLIGFGASLVVTIAAAINIAAFISPTLRDGLGTALLVISSIGTTALGLRERLKFHETAIIARRLSIRLQRHGFLFLSHAEPYGGPDPQKAFTTFMTFIERLKMSADHEQMKLKNESMDETKRSKLMPPQKPNHNASFTAMRRVPSDLNVVV